MNKLERTNLISTRTFLLMLECGLLLRMVILYSLLDTRIDSALFSLITVVGAVALATNALLWLQNREWPNLLLAAIIVAMLISTIFVREASLFSNLKMMVWQTLYFFVIYYIGKNHDNKLLRWFENVLIGFWTVAVVFSLALFIIRFTYTQPLKQIYYGMRLGIVENRLYGIFVEPNWAANTSFIVSLFMVKRLLTGEGHKWFYGINLVLQFVYIVLSGSRSVSLDAAAIIFATVFIIWYHKTQSEGRLKQWGKAFGVGIISVGLFFGLSYGTKVVMPHLVVPTRVSFLNQLEKSDADKHVSLNREDVGGGADVSNGRLALWESAIEIFKSSPIYGASPRNFVDYARDNLPNTRIAKSEQTPHNFILLTLATTGLLGIIPLLVFLIMKIVPLIKAVWTSHGMKDIVFIINSMIVAEMLIFGCFMPDLMFENRIGALCFWLFLGVVTLGRHGKDELSFGRTHA